MSETLELYTLKKHLSANGGYKFADYLTMHTKERCDLTENGNQALRFVKRAWIYGYRVRTLQDDHLKKNKMILKEKH